MLCKFWLEKYILQNGLVDVDETREEARKRGFSKKELKDARAELGVKTYHRFVSTTDIKKWYWYLPKT